MECLQVFKKLIEFFLNDQNFYVYFGCFYLNCRLSEDDEVEKCLQRVIVICEKLIGNRFKEDLDFKLCCFLMYVYYIYGMILKNRIVKYIGKLLMIEFEIKLNFDDFDKRLDEFIFIVEFFCEYF